MTIDAMGCRLKYVQIVSEGASYITGLKESGDLKPTLAAGEEILGTTEGVQCLEKRRPVMGEVEHRTWCRFRFEEVQQASVARLEDALAWRCAV
ncbi:MAG: hypothetical protein KF851_07345 [Pirellulaceae bacterium]|nr:hypothetical protein [Pirellulaceae bacterium]